MSESSQLFTLVFQTNKNVLDFVASSCIVVVGDSLILHLEKQLLDIHIFYICRLKIQSFGILKMCSRQVIFFLPVILISSMLKIAQFIDGKKPLLKSEELSINRIKRKQAFSSYNKSYIRYMNNRLLGVEELLTFLFPSMG